jgi:hypothetical protein
MRFISARVHKALSSLCIELGISLQELVVYARRLHAHLSFDVMSNCCQARVHDMQERDRTPHAATTIVHFALHLAGQARRSRRETGPGRVFLPCRLQRAQLARLLNSIGDIRGNGVTGIHVLTNRGRDGVWFARFKDSEQSVVPTIGIAQRLFRGVPLNAAKS